MLIRAPGQAVCEHVEGTQQRGSRESIAAPLDPQASLAGRNGRRARLAAVAAAGTATSRFPDHATLNSASSTNRTASSTSTLEVGEGWDFVEQTDRAVQNRAEVDRVEGGTVLRDDSGQVALPTDAVGTVSTTRGPPARRGQRGDGTTRV